jgi:enoyl-CoA hydratase/carnithine racemase
LADETYQTLLLDCRDSVAIVTLNRPEQRNAFDETMSTELAHALVTLDADEAVRAIVVTGAGPTFSVGADITGAALPGQRDGSPAGPAEPPSLRPWELNTPIIAAINGAAVGMGITYPMMWDIRVAAEDAKLGFVFTRRGLVPEGNASWLLQRLVGTGRAIELLLTGRLFSGAEAAAIGLVSRAVPRDEVLPVAVDIARDIAVNTAPAAVAATKRLVYRQLESVDRWAARQEELAMFTWARSRPDALEGVRAFLEKRPPAWTGATADDLPDEWR